MARRLSVKDRRTRLLEVGRRVFSEADYEDVRLDAIAAEAGVSKGLLYHYFPGKKAFYLATLTQVADELLVLTSPEGPDPTVEEVRRILLGFLRFCRENQRLYLALLRGGVGLDYEAAELVDRVRSIQADRLADYLGHADPSPTYRLAMYGFIGFAEALGVRYLTQDHTEDDVVRLLEGALATVAAVQASL